MKRNTSSELKKQYILKNGLESVSNIDMFEISELHEFEKNEFLIRSEIPSKYLYFLVSGEVIVTYSSFDKTVCVNYHKPLSWLGEASSLWQQRPNCNVQALGTCLCIAVDLALYREDLINDLTFLQNVSQILSYRLNHSTYQSSDLLEPTEIRLAKFILYHSSQNIFPLQLTNCALILNTSYRHLLRIMKDFCEKGFLKKTKNIYQITDRWGLEACISGNTAPPDMQYLPLHHQNILHNI